MAGDLTAWARARVGATLRNKYYLERVIGVGGMGAVYAATHRNRSRVAVKVLHPTIAAETTLRERFIREGYVANTVDHPGAVHVLDDDIAEDGSVFLVMELLEGETLQARWRKHGFRLPVPEVVAALGGVLEVLIAAHSKGIVHRDIKPENVFITRDERYKLLDFGVARVREASSLTRTGIVIGTPMFMPPEQVAGRNHEIDPRSDLWAVGATGFALLSGRFVHDASNLPAVLAAASSKPARPIATVTSRVPPALAGVIDRALAFTRDARWPNAQTMLEALRKAQEDMTIVARADCLLGDGLAPPETVDTPSPITTRDGEPIRGESDPPSHDTLPTAEGADSFDVTSKIEVDVDFDEALWTGDSQTCGRCGAELRGADKATAQALGWRLQRVRVQEGGVTRYFFGWWCAGCRPKATSEPARAPASPVRMRIVVASVLAVALMLVGALSIVAAGRAAPDSMSKSRARALSSAR